MQAYPGANDQRWTTAPAQRRSLERDDVCVSLDRKTPKIWIATAGSIRHDFAQKNLRCPTACAAGPISILSRRNCAQSSGMLKVRKSQFKLGPGSSWTPTDLLLCINLELLMISDSPAAITQQWRSLSGFTVREAAVTPGIGGIHFWRQRC